MNYEPVFKIDYGNIFITDLFIRSFVDADAIVTIRNRKWEFFLSKSNLDKYAEEGYKFALEGNKYKEFGKKHLIFIERFKQLKEINIENLDKKGFLKFLDKFKDFAVDFRDVYKETEFFYFTKIEKELNEFIKGRFSLQDLLSNKVEIIFWPEKIRKLAEYIIGVQYLKFEYRRLLNDIFLGKNSFASKILNQLVVKTGREDATSMTIEEVKACLNGKQIKYFSDRHIYSFINWNKEKQEVNIISGGDAYKKMREFDRYIPKNEVIGTPSCKGIVKGEAKIITRVPSTEYETFLKSTKRYILISDTTGPEFMPAIEKAAAIVTDEGGMMSHAAILSREFDIPCVVGTKYATKVFKDGDKIEVNANKGVVRKINPI
ncbi:hypothetical protein A3K73_00530 [Candidatus Pacearchaeota archaeon RBG_13_36_9]|nr:MAG: hypothetical protein A3K73_00530 [Candidatus Pacearchaeota archaeon RBG_13_36_9]